jgi:8-oxo-dGTP pyrophosphatase MutT (NUDIX family)
MITSFCNNCGKQGHVFNQCKNPITSYGLIAYRIKPGDTSIYSVFEPETKIEYLMIMRKDTLGYIDFVRGNYSVYNKEFILNMMKQMTQTEKERLKTWEFDQIWNELWGISNNDQFKNEENVSKDRFTLLRNGVYAKNEFYTLESIIEESNSEDKWEEPEWGFPKGRRNYQEKDYICATREFCEETGYKSEVLVPVKNVLAFEEIFTGSNYKSYRHKYYIVNIKYENTLDDLKIQKSEIGASKWLSYEECLAKIRHYNKEKIRILGSVNQTLLAHSLK